MSSTMKVMNMVSKVKQETERQDIRLLSDEKMNFHEIGVINPYTYLHLLYRKGYMTKRGLEMSMAEIENKIVNSPDVDAMDFMVHMCNIVEIYRSRQIPTHLDLHYNLKILVGVAKYFARYLKFWGVRL